MNADQAKFTLLILFLITSFPTPFLRLLVLTTNGKGPSEASGKLIRGQK